LSQSTIITPKMLVNFVTENIISYTECLAHFYVFCAFVIAECRVLSAMAYGHSVAICKPLLYNVTMYSQIYTWMVLGMYGIGLTSATAHTVCLIILSLCQADVINHYFCDLYPVLELSCSSTFINEVLGLCFCVFNIIIPSVIIFSFYIFILSSILHIRSTEGRSKAFSTCSSHIAVVGLFYGSTTFMYLQPSSVSSIDQGKVSSVFNTIIIPMLNPLIYSSRNKDVKFALNKCLCESVLCFRKKNNL
jgi:olfactory receptor